MTSLDTYKTIDEPSDEVLLKEKGSKFFGYAFPVSNEDDVKSRLEALRKKHHGAVHFCYAYQIGTENITFRANDDGEPGNSAGMPIYGQIKSFGLTNILVVVVRFFGGIKLGVGGLISAYKNTAQMAIEQSVIVEKIIRVYYKLVFDYAHMNKAMRIIKENHLQIEDQNSDIKCELIISARKNSGINFQEVFGVYNGFLISVVDKKPD